LRHSYGINYIVFRYLSGRSLCDRELFRVPAGLLRQAVQIRRAVEGAGEFHGLDGPLAEAHRRKAARPPYDRQSPLFPASITLGNNFRSRAQVTETTNFLFRRLMHRDTGGIVYDEKEELVASGIFPNDRAADYDTELLILENERYKGELSAAQAEARLIGERILSMIADGYQVTDGKDKTRNAAYRDFCILMKSTSKNGPIFTKELQAMGQRILVARQLSENQNYNQVYAKTGVSSATICRVNKCLQYGGGGYKIVLDRLIGKGSDQDG